MLNAINEKTKVCKSCGKKLPLEEFVKIYRKNYSNICKKCHVKKRQETVFNNKLKNGEIIEKDFVVIERIYKKISNERVLRRSVSTIPHIARDERFVKLFDYKDSWVSNYGRLIVKDDAGTYQLVKGNRIRATGELTYTLYKNTFFKIKKQWGYKKETVLARDLVIQTFIVNYDIKNNTACWHNDNNVKDNYYKNLHPVTELQYQEIKNRWEKNGSVSEDEIIQIVNQKEYKQQDWKPWEYVRTYNEKGYLGMDDIDYHSDAWIRWTNMMQRCYSEKIHKYKPYYKNCSVCEEWHNFSNFKIWYDTHFIPGTQVDLDKDLIGKCSNVYSPETCSLITHFMNTLFEKRGTSRRISKNKKGKFSASMLILNKNILIGEYETEEEAKKGFAEYKKNYIKNIAEKSKDKVPNYVYEAMIDWDVEMVA